MAQVHNARFNMTMITIQCDHDHREALVRDGKSPYVTLNRRVARLSRSLRRRGSSAGGLASFLAASGEGYSNDTTDMERHYLKNQLKEAFRRDRSPRSLALARTGACALEKGEFTFRFECVLESLRGIFCVCT
jgi:hypothetical protein